MANVQKQDLFNLLGNISDVESQKKDFNKAIKIIGLSLFSSILVSIEFFFVLAGL